MHGTPDPGVADSRPGPLAVCFLGQQTSHRLSQPKIVNGDAVIGSFSNDNDETRTSSQNINSPRDCFEIFNMTREW